MPNKIYLHEHPEFSDLIRIVAGNLYVVRVFGTWSIKKLRCVLAPFVDVKLPSYSSTTVFLAS